MSKESGLGFSVTIDNSAGAGKDISNDITNFQFATPKAIIEVTGVDKSAMERIFGLADFSATFNGEFNDEADKSHSVFSTVASSNASRTVALVHSGQTLSVECLLTDYQLNRSDAGELSWQVPAALSNGTVPTWS